MDERRKRRAPERGRSGVPRGKRPVKRSRRARRRRRNAIIRWTILIILVIAAAGGFLIWRKYGSSNEKADLGQYYDIGAEDGIAVVINNEVVREDEDAATDDANDTPTPGKIYDGQYYIEYSVVRERINERFYWDTAVHDAGWKCHGRSRKQRLYRCNRNEKRRLRYPEN